MTTRDLIELLQQLEPDSTVVAQRPGGIRGSLRYQIEGLHQSLEDDGTWLTIVDVSEPKEV